MTAAAREPVEMRVKEQWQYQLRAYLTDEAAEVARIDRNDSTLHPLKEILDKHHATLVSQFDAFQSYVAAAEKEGPESFPLYQWTKATIEDPVKRAKHSRSFALRVSGKEVYPREIADKLEADLQRLVGGSLVTRISRHDTNPANNLPIPSEYRA
ncbi:hypothetical protein [Rhodopila sp.]|uniref:hypothetical protein n=1 Tax=Rhodopila sp. TaxID=2480087 RepID=UPI003D11C27A